MKKEPIILSIKHTDKNIVLNQDFAFRKVFVFFEKGDLDAKIITQENLEYDLEWFCEDVEKKDLNLNFLLENGVKIKIVGRYNLSKKAELNQKIIIEHKKNSKSEILIKNALDDSAKFSALGQIIVPKGVFGVETSYLQKTLMLSKDCKIVSQPDLKIANNNVKCKHGSTIFKIKDEELFYLQTRGLSKEKIKELFSTGFLVD